MSKKRKYNSFAKRLTKWLVLVLFVILGFAAYLIFSLASSFVYEEEGMRHEILLNEAVEKVRQVLSDVYVGTVNHVPDIEENLDRPDFLFDKMEEIVSLNSRIRSIGLCFVADYYPQKGRWFCPYAVRLDDGKIEKKNVGNAQYDYLTSEWFVEALKADSSYWSKPFFEGNDTITPLVSYLIPIHDKKGRTVGILGADVSLEWMKEKLKEKDQKINDKEWVSIENDKGKGYKRRPYSFIITSDGTFLVHPEDNRILRKNFQMLVDADSDTITNYVGQQMKAGKRGYFGIEPNEFAESFDFDGVSSYVFYSPVKYTDWSMALVVPAINFDIIAYAVGGFLAFFVLLALLVAYFVSRMAIRSATKPLNQLAASADEVAKGNFNATLPKIKHKDEIRQLRDSFEQMQNSLTQYIAELKETTAEKASIENELRVAHDIQMSMLPKTFPPFPERNDIDLAASLTPAKDVGGDLFDFFIRDNRLFFCIADVSGKGIPASLLMAVTRSLFRNVAAHVLEPNLIVATLNKAIVENNEKNMFVTVFVGVLDLATGELLYCNAGHNSPLLIGDGVGFLPCDPNLPIGVIPGYGFSLQQTTLQPKTTIFLYTDGLNEAENIRHALFGDNRVLEVAQTLLDEDKNQVETIVKEMAEAVHAFVGEAEPSDDLTMLAVQFLGEGK